MPVVPWIEKETFVRSQLEFSAGGGVSGSRILVSNFDETQFKPGETNACYDLCVGERYRDHRKSDVFAVGEEFTLVAGSAIIIETREEFHFPQSRFGYVVPKVGMLQQGVSNTMSKVDPGYHGPLLITIFNLGKKDVRIRRSQRICALVVHDVGKGTIPYDRPAKQLPGRTRWNLRPGQWLDRLQGRSALVALVALIVSIVLAVIQLLTRR